MKFSSTWVPRTRRQGIYETHYVTAPWWDLKPLWLRVTDWEKISGTRNGGKW